MYGFFSFFSFFYFIVCNINGFSRTSGLGLIQPVQLYELSFYINHLFHFYIYLYFFQKNWIILFSAALSNMASRGKNATVSIIQNKNLIFKIIIYFRNFPKPSLKKRTVQYVASLTKIRMEIGKYLFVNIKSALIATRILK